MHITENIHLKSHNYLTDTFKIKWLLHESSEIQYLYNTNDKCFCNKTHLQCRKHVLNQQSIKMSN